MPAHYTHLAWSGDPGIGERLADLWARYLPQAEPWKRREDDAIMRTAEWQTPANHRKLWDDVQPFRAHLPPMRIVLVDYPQPVLWVQPPASAVFSAGSGGLNWPAYATTVLRAAQALASQHDSS